MINLKEIPEIFGCYNFEQILTILSEGRTYLENGEDKFPIDLRDSVRFLEDLEELFKSLVYSDQKSFDVEDHWVNLFSFDGTEEITDNPLRIFDTKLKVLVAEMRMVLTRENMDSYLNLADFLDILLLVLNGKRK